MINSLNVISKPKEYFFAQVYFAHKMAKLTSLALSKSMIEYTDLYQSLTTISYGEKEGNGEFCKLWIEYLEQINSLEDPDSIAEVTYNLFLMQAHSKETLRLEQLQGENTFGCFSIDYGPYNKERNQVKLHFVPTRKDLFKTDEETRHGDLSTYYLDQRKTEFKAAITHIKQNPDLFIGANYLKSSTWLQNLPNYQCLFPARFSEDKNRTKRDDSFLGLWGQFIKWDLTGNVEVYNRFIEKLSRSQNTQEAIDAFPMPVYAIHVPLDELFEMYGVV